MSDQIVAIITPQPAPPADPYTVSVVIDPATLPIGPQGEQGPVGRDGKDGRDGQDGQDGKDGQDGAGGADGQDGQDGRDGKDGQDGARGSLFLGSVATAGDLPAVNGMAIRVGDFVYVQSTGELWQAV